MDLLNRSEPIAGIYGGQALATKYQHSNQISFVGIQNVLSHQDQSDLVLVLSTSGNNISPFKSALSADASAGRIREFQL
jgi:ABC-type enterochelin transport system substrate-binding protein